jgi:hypothetical protein
MKAGMRNILILFVCILMSVAIFALYVMNKRNENFESAATEGAASEGAGSEGKGAAGAGEGADKADDSKAKTTDKIAAMIKKEDAQHKFIISIFKKNAKIAQDAEEKAKDNLTVASANFVKAQKEYEDSKKAFKTAISKASDPGASSSGSSASASASSDKEASSNNNNSSSAA